MGQKLRQDKIGVLSHSAGTISMAASASNPAFLSIGGQQYRITANLTVAVGTATASTLYMIYAVVSAGVVSLVKDTNFNSVGPTAQTSWKLIGAFYSAAANTWGSFVSIEGIPTSERIPYTPVSTQGFGTISSVETHFTRMGKQLILSGRFNAGTAAASEARYGLPGTLTASSKYSGNNPVGRALTDESNINIVKDLGVKVAPGNNYVQFGRTEYALANNPYTAENGNTVISNNRNLSFHNVIIEIEEWTTTPLKDL